MYLLIDECCSDGLRTVAEKLGHVAQLTKHAKALGRGQDDAVIFDFAGEHGAVLVTVASRVVASSRTNGAGTRSREMPR